MFQKLYNSLLTVFYPQDCRICGKIVENSADGVACSECWKKTRLFDGKETLCKKCSRFLHSQSSGFSTFCHLCDQDFYDFACAVGLYEKAIAATVLALKKQPFVSLKVRNLFISALERAGFDATLIIPVPLSKKRRIERGFNQAEILAEIAARATGLEYNSQILVRKAHTPMHRAAMDKKMREATVRNAFEVVCPKFVENEKILLIDDVFTSGATASYCARELKKKGANKVSVLTLARAL
jgi:ComF family protein